MTYCGNMANYMNQVSVVMAFSLSDSTAYSSPVARFDSQAQCGSLKCIL